MTEASSGLGLALMAFTAAGAFLFWGAKLDSWDVNKVCAAGILITALSVFMIGPALPLPETLWIMLPGEALLGVGASGV